MSWRGYRKSHLQRTLFNGVGFFLASIQYDIVQNLLLVIVKVAINPKWP